MLAVWKCTFIAQKNQTGHQFCPQWTRQRRSYVTKSYTSKQELLKFVKFSVGLPLSASRLMSSSEKVDSS